MVLPDGTVIRPVYKPSNHVETLTAQPRGAGPFVTVLAGQDRDAAGRRLELRRGNGTTTSYTHDADSRRLTRLTTWRTGDAAVLQDLAYAYDPTGHVTAVDDAAQQVRFFDNAVVRPQCRYEYDALYQLVTATGREQSGAVADAQRDARDLPINPLPHPNDPAAVRNYTETYTYDDLGNLLTMQHAAPGGSWTRRYQYRFDANPTDRTNRLAAGSVPGDPVGTFSTAVHP